MNGGGTTLNLSSQLLATLTHLQHGCGPRPYRIVRTMRLKPSRRPAEFPFLRDVNIIQVSPPPDTPYPSDMR
eukprot:155495-Lingulodinium_polyedra.AAC.1